MICENVIWNLNKQDAYTNSASVLLLLNVYITMHSTVIWIIVCISLRTLECFGPLTKCHEKLVSNKSLNLTRLSYMKRSHGTMQLEYDHFCPFMKARYNCAKNSSQHFESAYQWGLAVKSNDETFFLRDLVQKLGGIENVFTSMASQFRHSKSRANVLLTGNSYIRQIWESIACRYRHKSNGGSVQMNGPDMSIRNIQEIGSFDVTSLGDMVSISMVRGCHGKSFSSDYYREGVIIPPQTASCNDDLAMIEVERVRYFFVFRPYVFKNFTHVLASKLGLKIDDIDIAVVNDRNKDNEKFVYSLLSQRADPIPLIDLSELLPYLRNLQMRDCGKWFGADNPFITRPPDGHPCMPGVPDDEADIVLLMLKWGLSGIAV